jgi:hypothetical protein
MAQNLAKAGIIDPSLIQIYEWLGLVEKPTKPIENPDVEFLETKFLACFQ